jgi:hypothetical protein
MLKDYRTQAAMGIWGGLLFFLLGYMMAVPETVYYQFGMAMLFGSYVLLVIGCFMYARGKGYGWSVGALGILGPPGLLILYLLRDKSAEVLKKQMREKHL